MDYKALIAIIILGVLLLSSLITLLVALFRGDMKKFITEKIAEADSHSDWTGEQKRNFVIEAFKEKYKIMEFLLNAKKFIELVIKYSKEINYKK